MNHPQNFLLVLIALLFCACVGVVGLPAGLARGESDGLQSDELSHLAQLIGKLKKLDKDRQGGQAPEDNWSLLGKAREAGSRQTAPSPDRLTALRQGFLGFDKRQGGAWSYDYGLGGGRFGKRYYGDYGIGGGRFGRDVDHVDIADTNDATL